MTIAFVNSGTFANGTTTVASAYGAGSATDVIIHCIGNKPFGSTPTNANNTQLTTITSGSVANAVSSGSVRATAFQRNSSPTGASSDSFAVTSGSPAMGQALRFSTSLGGTWSVSSVSVADTTETGTAVSALANSATAGQFAAGDWIVISVVLKDDAITHSSQSVQIELCTLGSITWIGPSTTTTGNDGAMYTGYAQITAGSSPASGEVQYQATSSVSGASATAVNVVRLREVPPYAGPTWVSHGGSTGGLSAASAAPTLPSSIAANDVVVVELYVENGAVTVTPPDGTWTQKIVERQTVGGSTLSHFLFWKRMAGGETGTVSFTWSGSFWREGIAHKISGCRTSGDPFDQITSANTGGTAATNTPAVSLTSVPADVLLFWSSTNWAGGLDVTPPTGYTERIDGDVIGSATKQNTTAGNTGTVQGSWNGSQQQTVILATLTSTSGTTPVTGSVAVSWNVAAQVTGSALETWNTREEVTKSAAESWNTRELVTSSAAESWNVRQAVSNSAAESWNTYAPVTGSAAESWNTRALVTGSAAESWNVFQAVTASAAEVWKVYELVTGSALETWNVAGPVQVTGSSAQSWNVYELVSKSAAESWNTYAAVTNSAAESWNVFQAVSAAAAQSWNTRALVTGNAAESWNVYSVVTNSSAQSWRVFVVVSNSSVQSWNVLGAGQVTGGISQSWNVRSLVTGAAQESWNVFQAVSGTNAQSWRVYAPVTGSNANSWNVRALVTGAAAESWNVRQLITGQAPESWNVYVPVTGNSAQTWRVLVPVTKSAAVSWDVAELVTGSNEQLWNVYELVTGSSEQLWRVFIVELNLDHTRHVLPLTLGSREVPLIQGSRSGSLILTNRRAALILPNTDIPLQLGPNGTGLQG